MKTLVVVGHPNLGKSLVNRAWRETAIALPDEDVLVHTLADTVSRGLFDVAEEQRLLVAADRLILQFPLWWYMPPAVLKKWMDTVWTEGFAYGEGGDKLRHLRIDVAVSCGAPEVAFSGTSLRTYLSYIPGSIDFVQAIKGELFALYDADNIARNHPEALAKSCEDYEAFVLGTRHGTQL
ncbi:MAG: NAD(P)H-dependent oxidoreductase [Porphyromonas sp.]|nr:NAD(P)H-dependent oxidoreductase [Bacteroidales bacterium]MDD7560108.1 NAD(P)H-dependent oxidoreductase [Bacteroidales bacterium]MDY3100879.1 NAD(P)H-dependent oxidoreductase [Porphyromonas sp.]